MRKIIAGLFITLDGVVEAPEKWNPPYYDDEMSQAVMVPLAAAGAHLYGRRSYELFRSVFTGPAAPPHAQMMTSMPKLVVSTALRRLVHPVIAGRGRRLSEGDDQNLPLTLIQARAHQNGIVALRYTLGHGTAAPTFAEVSQCVS